MWHMRRPGRERGPAAASSSPPMYVCTWMCEYRCMHIRGCVNIGTLGLVEREGSCRCQLEPAYACMNVRMYILHQTPGHRRAEAETRAAGVQRRRCCSGRRTRSRGSGLYSGGSEWSVRVCAHVCRYIHVSIYPFNDQSIDLERGREKKRRVEGQREREG